ncbi:hypothetical protein [Paracoccus beibuensis]|nr:hypothetical protein [Paracoccus beibuensis]
MTIGIIGAMGRLGTATGAGFLAHDVKAVSDLSLLERTGAKAD